MTTYDPNKTYYAVALIFSGNDEFTAKDENENPTLFTSHIEAWKDIADDQTTILTQFLNGERELENTDFEQTMYVVGVKIENGIMYAISLDTDELIEDFDTHTINGQLENLTIAEPYKKVA